MYRLLLVLMVASAAKVDFKSFDGCRPRECVRRIDAAVKRVLKIDWQPISVFPEEERKFGH